MNIFWFIFLLCSGATCLGCSLQFARFSACLVVDVPIAFEMSGLFLIGIPWSSHECLPLVFLFCLLHGLAVLAQLEADDRSLHLGHFPDHLFMDRRSVA